MKPTIGHHLNTFLNGLLRGLVRAWLMVLPLVLALSLIRLGQVAYFWPTGYQVDATEVATVLFQGARFDLKVSAILGFLLLLVLPWVSGRINQRIAAGMAFVYVMLSLVNLHYFGFYKRPIDDLIFGLAEDDTVAVLHTIWRDFPVIWTVVLALVLSYLSSWLHRTLITKLKADTLLHTRHVVTRLLVLVLVFFALIFAGKGTLRQMALQRQHLTVTASQFLNDMVPNGVIALKYAWDSRGFSQNLDNPLAGLKAMGFESPLAAAEVLGLPSGSEAEVKAALTAHPPLPPGTAKKNLVFFLMESWSAEPMLYQSPQFDVLGRLAPTLDKACHFSNFDSAHAGTHPSLEAILFSTPLTPLTLGPVGRKPIPWSVARIAKEAGYQTLFVSSVRSGWRDLNRVLAAQGFDEVVDANHLHDKYPDALLGIWGVWDSYVFKYLKERMAKQQTGDKPMFVFVLTSTNHPPYDLPADYKRVPRDMALWKGETSSDTLVPNLDTYHYAADLLGDFVHDMQTGPRKADTVVAATGDHNVRSFGVYADAQRRHLMRQVPFVIWGQGVQCGPQQALPASHRDMFSTLFPLVGVEGAYINAGRNLLLPIGEQPAAMNAPRALFFTGEARNSQGMWQLGNPASFACSSGSGAQKADNCSFNAQDDQQERARFGLLDWNVRTSLKH
ncbi:LTA synthase family protein [Rhodoferax aquaticus]|uniref:LTA synthase family protein n=1 Tax=Rhodoferax aquaticus TaxID=2527691 RepID=A0A515ETU1_9BURK|nr:LTA synthase family protein [Rhodoferax aquaticus]QDL56038.1 LTA synthase family protein [Rhodoferax aquaticus]